MVGTLVLVNLIEVEVEVDECTLEVEVVHGTLATLGVLTTGVEMNAPIFQLVAVLIV